MNTVLLVYILLANEHQLPTHPRFFSVYPSETACQKAAEQYMSINGKVNLLVNAKCADASNPKLVPYLRNVPEMEAIDKNGGVIYYRHKDDVEI